MIFVAFTASRRSQPGEEASEDPPGGEQAGMAGNEAVAAIVAADAQGIVIDVDRHGDAPTSALEFSPEGAALGASPSSRDLPLTSLQLHLAEVKEEPQPTEEAPRPVSIPHMHVHGDPSPQEVLNLTEASPGTYVTPENEGGRRLRRRVAAQRRPLPQ